MASGAGRMAEPVTPFEDGRGNRFSYFGSSARQVATFQTGWLSGYSAPRDSARWPLAPRDRVAQW